MDSWTNQAGYPVIHVDTNTQENSMIITQVRGCVCIMQYF